MKIIGNISDKVFLLDIGNDEGQILDLHRGLLWPPTHMGSLINHGGPWDEYTGPQEHLAELLAQVKPAPPVDLPDDPPQTAEERAQLIKEIDARLEAKKKK
jgi:hypothetical protein